MVELLYRPDGNSKNFDGLAAKVNSLQLDLHRRTGCLIYPLPHSSIFLGKSFGVEISETSGNLEMAVREVITEIGVPGKVIAEGRGTYEAVERVLQESGHALRTPWSAFIPLLGSEGKVVTALN